MGTTSVFLPDALGTTDEMLATLGMRIWPHTFARTEDLLTARRLFVATMLEHGMPPDQIVTARPDTARNTLRFLARGLVHGSNNRGSREDRTGAKPPRRVIHCVGRSGSRPSRVMSMGDDERTACTNRTRGLPDDDRERPS